MLSRALEVLEELIVDASGQVEALALLREICEELGSWEQALVHQVALERATGVPQPDIRSHLQAGIARSLAERGELEAAKAAATGALEAAPSNANAYLAMGELCWMAGDREGADHCWQRAVASSPDSVSLVLAYLEPRLHRHELEEQARLWLQRLPEHPDAKLWLASLLRTSGRTAEAGELLRELLHQHPSRADAREELGRLVIDAGSAAELRSELEAALAGVRRRPYGCSRCHVELSRPSFRCPRCCSWDTVGLATGEDASGVRGSPPGALDVILPARATGRAR
jgi:lipopolysaccharide biosynthesis regulator YciM